MSVPSDVQYSHWRHVMMHAAGNVFDYVFSYNNLKVGKKGKTLSFCIKKELMTFK